MISRDLLPKVCICIPAYNAEDTIAETLNSLINQTYKNIVIYVIDNNSQDSTSDIVKKFAEKNVNIKLFQYNHTVSIDENFDRCIIHAEGEYTCIFHSDDVYQPNIIEKEIDLLSKHDEIGAVFTCADIINENGEKISEFLPTNKITQKCIYDFQELFPLVLKYGMCFLTPSAMVKTEIYKNEIIKHKRQENFGAAFDVDVWLRILRNHKVGFVYENLMKYRLSIHSTSFRKLMIYKNTIEDGMFNVFAQNIKDTSFNDKKIIKSYLTLATKSKLSNIVKAYLCGDYNYAKYISDNLSTDGVKFKLKMKKYIYKTILLFELPEFIRKIIVYVKYRNVLKGQFNRIKLEKM